MSFFSEKLWAGFSFTSFFTVFKVASITFLSHFSGHYWRHSKMSMKAVGVGVSMRAWDAVNQFANTLIQHGIQKKTFSSQAASRVQICKHTHTNFERQIRTTTSIPVITRFREVFTDSCNLRYSNILGENIRHHSS